MLNKLIRRRAHFTKVYLDEGFYQKLTKVSDSSEHKHNVKPHRSSTFCRTITIGIFELDPKNMWQWQLIYRFGGFLGADFILSGYKFHPVEGFCYKINPNLTFIYSRVSFQCFHSIYSDGNSPKLKKRFRSIIRLFLQCLLRWMLEIVKDSTQISHSNNSISALI